MTTSRIRTGMALALALALGTAGCNILDVNNPNNLTQQDVENVAAANAVVNGALATTMRGIDAMALPFMQVSDELKWIGSRDAWLQLDHGNVSDPNNEFVDAAFPSLAQGRWMADLAVSTIQGHLADDPSNSDLNEDMARASFIKGMIYSYIAQYMQSFAFSDRTEPGPEIPAASMDGVFGQAIEALDQAVSQAQAVGDSDLALKALAVRAQAKHARAVRAKYNPTYSPGDGLVNDAGAKSDAAAVIAQVGTTSDWKYDFIFSSSTIGSSRGAWINQRAEQIFGARYAETDPASPASVIGFPFMDPIDNVSDPRVKTAIEDFLAAQSFPSLTIASAREMHLILAEAELASGNTAGAITHINHVRSITGMSPYSENENGVSVKDMLIHERTANLFGQGRRLPDMYRFGIASDNWLPDSEAMTAPGGLLPITCVEIRANPEIQTGRSRC